MQIAMGALGWHPQVFWSATPREFWAAFEGWRRTNAADDRAGTLSDEEVATLEDMKRRFPDDPRARPLRQKRDG
jgi:hypothetical protein